LAGIPDKSEAVEEEFRRVFAKRQFTEIAPVGVSSGVDPTVRFVGSAISVVKPIVLTDSIPHPGAFLIQPALRTQALKGLSDPGTYPMWPSYFKALGAVVSPREIAALALAALEFLGGVIDDASDRLVVRISSLDDDLIDIARQYHSMYDIEIDGCAFRSYRHKYGIDGLCGRNINYAVRDGRGFPHDIGNLILIEYEDRVVAAEMCSGVSNILTRLHGLQHPIQASTIASFVPLLDWRHVKLADALSSAAVLVAEGLRPVGTGRHRCAREYLQSVGRLREQSQVPIGVVVDWAASFLEAEYGGAGDLACRIGRYLAVYEELTALGNMESPSINAIAGSKF
jgi:hypothetical protein